MKKIRWLYPKILPAQTSTQLDFEITAEDAILPIFAYFSHGPLRYLTSLTNNSHDRRTSSADRPASARFVCLFTCSRLRKMVYCRCRNRSDKGAKYSFFSVSRPTKEAWDIWEIEILSKVVCCNFTIKEAKGHNQIDKVECFDVRCTRRLMKAMAHVRVRRASQC